MINTEHKAMKIINRNIFILILIQLLFLNNAFANLPKNITTTFPSSTITNGLITLKAPDIAENGAVVNVSIKNIQLPNKDLFVKEIWIFDHFRKLPMAHFKLNKNTLANGLSSRFKLVGSSVIYAIALLNDGSMISGEKAVKVTIGGCGGGNYVVHNQNYSRPPYYPAVTQNHRSIPVNTWKNTEQYSTLASNGIVQTENKPVSTFSIDVDTGSYSNIRRFLLKQGRFPVTNAVRVEEMINYFPYQYAQPITREKPFSITTEVGPTPWNKDTHLLQIGLQGYEEDRNDLPPANLVFLIDVSGSMRRHDKIGLLKSSLRMLSKQLNEQDKVAIVAYAGVSGVILDTTQGNDTHSIINALNRLSTGGSTHGSSGIKLAYDMARSSFIENGINRVILATDGDFNVGVVNHEALIRLIKEKKKSGISLTTLGFGTGNYNEKLMEQLADHGDGNYAYIDTLKEARKVLVTQLSSTLFTIARDVKIQVEFNPEVVSQYRLIGYENRLLKREDFKNDKVDAGDIGAGHTVTALYEIAFVGSNNQAVEPLRYTSNKSLNQNNTNELAYIRMRYKNPDENHSVESKHPIYRATVKNNINDMSDNYRFASAVAAFGQLLRKSNHINSMNYDQIYTLASRSLGADINGYRKEFLDLVDAANSLN